MFRLRQDDYQVQTRRAVLDNSITVKVGQLIIPTASGSAVTNATATIAGDKYPLGLVVGFSGPNGEVISQGQNPLNTPNQLTTAADNLTVAKYNVVYVPLTTEMELIGTLSATAGTTAGSDAAFTWFNLSDAGTIDETSVQVYTNVALQVFSYGLDPNDSTNTSVICRIRKNALQKAE